MTTSAPARAIRSKTPAVVATRGGAAAAAVASSVGVRPGPPLVNGPSAGWMPTLVQVAYATGIGLLFAALRLRTGTLLVPILLHALLDWSFYLGGDVFTPTAAGHASIVVPLVVGAALAACGSVLLRRGVSDPPA